MQMQLRQAEQKNEELKQDNFRLQLETQTVADIQRDLEETLEARDKIERSIRNVTAEPFLQKEDGNTIKVRIEDLRHRLGEKESLARKRKEEEKKITEEFKELEIEMHKLTGEKNQIEGTHKALKEEF